GRTGGTGRQIRAHRPIDCRRRTARDRAKRRALMPRTALVTGGSRGIGRAIAETLASGGHAVTLTYATREREANAVAEAIRSSGGGGVARPPLAQGRGRTPPAARPA